MGWVNPHIHMRGVLGFRGAEQAADVSAEAKGSSGVLTPGNRGGLPEDLTLALGVARQAGSPCPVKGRTQKAQVVGPRTPGAPARGTSWGQGPWPGSGTGRSLEPVPWGSWALGGRGAWLPGVGGRPAFLGPWPGRAVLSADHMLAPAA